jgi:hypothetical protein
MSESHVMDGRLSSALRFVAGLPAAPLTRLRYELLAIALLCPILMLAAFGNGFPIIFYDTGAYVLQGFDHIFIAERSPVYSLFLKYAGGPESLWYVALVQCAIVAFAMTEFARALKPQLSLWTFLAIGLVLTLVTGLPWYAAQIEPDCFAAVTALALYLLAFHARDLGFVRGALMVLCAGFAAATHSTHLGLAAGLLIVLVALRLAALAWRDLPRPAILLPTASCVLAVAIVFAGNYAFTRQIFVSRVGSVFLAARMMQDGLIKPVLDADCPEAGYRMCAYKDHLPPRADAWLWEEKASPFSRTGGFRKWGPESSQLIAASLSRYPLANAAWAGIDTALEFFAYATGDGIVPQEWVLDPEFRRTIPAQMRDYNHAYQQRGYLWFLPLNIVHVPVALFAVGVLFWLAWRALGGRRWNQATLPVFVLVALLGNAFLCGVFSGPHFRYQSRMMWWPALTVVLLCLESIPALRRREESVT